MQEYKVCEKVMKALRINKDFEVEFAIVHAYEIEEIELSEAFDKYGCKWGEEYEDEFVSAINYFDGRNWRTLFVGDNHVMECDLDYIDEEQEQEILALYEDIGSGDWEECGAGMKSCEKGGHKFILSSWGNDSWNVVRVKEI